MTVIVLVCLSSALLRADGSVDENSVTAMFKEEKEQMQEQIAQLQDKMMAKDEAIATLLTAAAEAKATDHKQHVQLMSGGEIVELVSAADVRALAKRLEACERKIDDRDAVIGVAVATAPSGERVDQLARALDAAKAKIAAQEAKLSELSASVARLFEASAQGRPMQMPVGAAETTAPPPATAEDSLAVSGRRLSEGGDSAPAWEYVGKQCTPASPGSGDAVHRRRYAQGMTRADCQARCNEFSTPSDPNQM